MAARALGAGIGGGPAGLQLGLLLLQEQAMVMRLSLGGGMCRASRPCRRGGGSVAGVLARLCDSACRMCLLVWG